MFRYRNNSNMNPDWRNQRWLHQETEKETEVDPRVIVGSLGISDGQDHHRGSTFAFNNLINNVSMEYSLYAVRRSSVLRFSKPFLVEVIRHDPLVVRCLSESTSMENVGTRMCVERRKRTT